jgi:adenylosuccinate synthase
MRHRAIIVTDLFFGDCGKGSVVDFYARTLVEKRGSLPLVVRHSGGAQAAHAVVTARGERHVFQQLGAASFVGCATHLSRFMLVNPLTLFWEAERFGREALSKLTIHESALVTTPWHMALNRIVERRRGAGAHGSCGLGIGATMAHALEFPEEAIRAGDLSRPELLREKCRALRARLEVLVGADDGSADVALFADDEELEGFGTVAQSILGTASLVGDRFLQMHLADPRTATIFEGAQGVLLDEWWGFHPHTTWSTVTAHNAFRLLHGAEAEVLSVGVLRGYATRHGAGPLPTEESDLTALLPDDTNPDNPWQGHLRVGWPDLTLLRYALSVAGRIDALAVTCLDRMAAIADWRVGVGYDGGFAPLPKRKTDLNYRGAVTRRLLAARPLYRRAERSPDAHARFLARALGCPLALESYGPTSEDKRDGASRFQRSRATT